MYRFFIQCLLLLSCSLCATVTATAQARNNIDILATRVNVPTEGMKQSYWTTGMEGLIIGTSYYARDGESRTLSPLRFSGFFHLGARYHYDFNQKAGFMTGLGIKNIGFIDKYTSPDSTVKRRLYTLSIPMAIKLGNMDDDKFWMLGAGVDVALHYKEKGFVNRNNKQVINEWFSKRTPFFLPNVFVGYASSFGLYFTYHYYPINFLNQTYEDNTFYKPYAGYTVNLMYLTIGYRMRYFPKYDR